MATSLIPVGTTDATSSPFTLADGETATIFVRPDTGLTVPQTCNVDIQIQCADSSWVTVYTIESPKSPTAQFKGPGVFRVSRLGRQAPAGVERA